MVFLCPSRSLQPRMEINNISETPGYGIRFLLLSPAMGSEAGMVEQAEGRRLYYSPLCLYLAHNAPFPILHA